MARHLRWALLLLLTPVVALSVALAPSASAAYSQSAYAQRLFTLLNQTRAQYGLGPLQWTSGTSQVAQAWTEQLASQGYLEHNPNLANDLAAHGSPDWQVIGENVGTGNTSDPDGLFTAYMQSPEHRANILKAAFRYVGLGIVYVGTQVYNTMDFVDQYSTNAPAAAPAPAPAAAPVAPAPAAPAAAPAQAPVALPVQAAPAAPVAAPAHHASTRHLHRTAHAPRLRPTASAAPPVTTDAAPPSGNVLAAVETRTLAAGFPQPAGADGRALAIAAALLLVAATGGSWARTVGMRRRRFCAVGPVAGESGRSFAPATPCAVVSGLSPIRRLPVAPSPVAAPSTAVQRLRTGRRSADAGC